MTAIIGFQVEGQPVIFGDLLLSAPNVLAPDLPTMVRSHPEAPRADGLMPAGLGQKITIIHPDFVVAWSGRMAIARRVVNELMGRYSNQAPTEAQLNEYFESLPEVDRENLHILAMVAVAPTRIYHLGFNAFAESDQRFGIFRMAGSGFNAVADLLRSTQSFSERQGRQLNPYAKAVGCALSMAGYLMGREIIVGDTLSRLYGGGYEIATRVGGRWQKLPDVMTIFWVTRETAQGTVEIVPLPIRVVRQSYHGDLLIVRALSCEPDVAVDEKRFIINPVHRDSSEDEKGSIVFPGFAAQWICHQFIVHRLNGTVTPQSRVTFTENVNESAVQVRWDGSRLEVVVRSDYFEQLKEFARPSSV